MQLTPNDDDRALARATFEQFAGRPGAQHIATEFALTYLSALLRTQKPASVLEIGAGIGTITSMLLEHPCGIKHVTSTEDHPFCLEQLEANLPSERDRLELIKEENRLGEIDRNFDLIIFDGEFGAPEKLHFLDDRVVCFVEGSRTSARNALSQHLAGKGLACQFTNYNRGRKLVSMAWREKRRLGLRLPKLRFNRTIKGCWVGVVSALA
ncbi:MAG: class I SAM-dependent methyltransferase [Geminicoccaceae bacterium]